MTAPIAPPTAGSPFEPYAPPAAGSATRATRLDGVDLVRGLVMVVMLLDHTRDFVHTGGFLQDPTDLATTSVPLFLTRWVTHFCAPAFFFLAGTGAFLQRLRGKPAGALARFLVTRGLWLALLELTVIRLVAFSGFGITAPFQLGVLWALGLSMVCLAGLVRLPAWVSGAVGLTMIAAHNLLDGRLTAAVWQGPGSPVPSATDKLVTVLHQQGPFPVAGWPSPVVMVLYPLVPWIGVMAAGYACGAVYRLDAARRRRVLLGLGAALVAAFVLIRAARGYGDPAVWQPAHPRGAVFGLLSFVNAQKYPPSLLFLLMTLGPTLMLLGALEWGARLRELASSAAWRRAVGWLVTFGRVPLFFYVLQWVVAHGLAVVLGLAAGQPVAHLFTNMAERFASPPRGVGFGLPVVYAAWAAGVLLCYPACRWFAGVKARRRDLAWLSYL